MAEWRTDFHCIPVEREEYRIKAEFDEESPELLRILGEARSQENLTGYPRVAYNNRHWLLITETYNFYRSKRRVVLELLRIETP